MFAALVAPVAIAGAYATADARAPRSTLVACWIVVVALSLGLVGRSVGAGDLGRAGGRRPEVAVAAGRRAAGGDRRRARRPPGSVAHAGAGRRGRRRPGAAPGHTWSLLRVFVDEVVPGRDVGRAEAVETERDAPRRRPPRGGPAVAPPRARRGGVGRHGRAAGRGSAIGGGGGRVAAGRRDGRSCSRRWGCGRRSSGWPSGSRTAPTSGWRSRSRATTAVGRRGGDPAAAGRRAGRVPGRAAGARQRRAPRARGRRGGHDRRRAHGDPAPDRGRRRPSRRIDEAAAVRAGRRGIADMRAEAASCGGTLALGPGRGGVGTAVAFDWREPPASR